MNLFKNQELFQLEIISFILGTLMCDSGVLLQGEIRCKAPFGIKGLIEKMLESQTPPHTLPRHFKFQIFSTKGYSLYQQDNFLLFSSECGNIKSSSCFVFHFLIFCFSFFLFFFQTCTTARCGRPEFITWNTSLMSENFSHLSPSQIFFA